MQGAKNSVTFNTFSEFSDYEKFRKFRSSVKKQITYTKPI